MPRYRQADTRWLYAAGVAGAYAVAVATLFTLQIGTAVSLPMAVVVLAPVLVYAALSLVLVRDAPLGHRMPWIGRACLMHVVLGILASAELMWVAGLPAPAAGAEVFGRFAPAPVLTLLATPLVLGLLGAGARRPGPRVEPPPRRSTAPAAPRSRSLPRTVAPRRTEAHPAVTPAPSAFGPAPGSTQVRSVARSAFRLPAPTDVPLVAVAASLPVASAVALAAPPRPSGSPDEAVEPPAALPVAREVAEPPTPLPVPLPPEAPSGARRPPPAERSASPGDEAVVRISFDRVAAQLPAEAFVLPLDRLGESLGEPHTLLVPRRDEVLAQLPPDTRALASAVLSADGATAPSQAAPPAPLGPPPAEWRRILDAFSGVGVFQATFEAVGARPLVSFVEPGLERSAVAACAAALVRLADGSGEVVTARTARAVVVLAVGPIAILAAARRPGVPAALLELRAVRAAATPDAGTVMGAASPRRPLEPRRVTPEMMSAAQALASFGAVRPAVFADRSARVYVFSAGDRDAAALGERALAVCAALADAWELGPLVSVVFRRGGELTLVRPLAGGGTLAVAGPVARPGRAHRDAERAAGMLEMV